MRDLLDQRAERKVECSVCGSANVIGEQGIGPTGVVSEDGFAEYRSWLAIRCLDCDAVEEV